MARIVPRVEMAELFLQGLLTDTLELKREFRRRNTSREKRIVPLDDVEKLVDGGWNLIKTTKSTGTVDRPKKPQDQLEDDTWSLLYRMGYRTLNRYGFRLPYYRADGTPDSKQVDVLAKDDETVLVIECKCAIKRTRRSLQKDLAETQSFKRQMASAIHDSFGKDYKPKIVWLYVTRNIIWSEPDLERANAARIKVLTENEISYYDAYISHMGPAGRFQVLAEFLEGERLKELADIRVPAIKGKLGKYNYYSFVTTPKHLLKISFVNHLALNHPDGRPAYQRMINKGRLKKIANFINAGGYFPTNILINMTQQCRFDLLSNKNSAAEAKYGWLYLPDKYKSAWVIDGQHRLYGYSLADDTHWDDDVFVLAFEKMDTATEAELFITINHEQKSVPKSILVALQADLKWGAEDSKDRLGALSSALAKSLNADPSSPLARKFVIDGIRDTGQAPLTIPEVVKGIDRARLLGRVVHGTLVPGPLSSDTDDNSVKRARAVLKAYFERIREADTERWESGRAGYVLSNPGIRAYLQLLAEILAFARAKRRFDAELATPRQIMDEVEPFLRPVAKFIATSADELLAEKFSRKFGEGGVREYFYNLCEIAQQADSNFGPEEFRRHMALREDDRLKDAHTDVIDLNAKLMDYVCNRLQAIYGQEKLRSGEEAYWARGIESNQIKENAYKKQLAESTDKRRPIFAYLDFLDLKKIVRQKNNWPYFEDVFNIPMPGERGKTYYLDWMDQFNELRRFPAHSSSMRLYEESDYRFLDWLKGEIYPRLDVADIKQGVTA